MEVGELEISGLRLPGGGGGRYRQSPQIQLKETVHTPSAYLILASAQDWRKVVGMGY